MSRPSKDVTRNKLNPEAQGLPTRWALILFMATAVGVAIGIFGGVVVGVPAGIAAAAAFHKLIA